MITNFSIPVSSRKTAHAALYRLVGPILNGFFRDNNWVAPNQLFRAIHDMGGQVSINKTEYFSVGGVADMGKRWMLTVTTNGFTYPAILTASFADKPNGDVYDLTLTV